MSDVLLRQGIHGDVLATGGTDMTHHSHRTDFREPPRYVISHGQCHLALVGGLGIASAVGNESSLARLSRVSLTTLVVAMRSLEDGRL